MSTPSNNDEIEIKPISVEKYQPEDKSYVLEPNTYDIGKYLNLLKIKPYQKITIQLKEGNYIWDDEFAMPRNTTIWLKGDEYRNGGCNNLSTIIITKKHTKMYENKEHSLNARLYISSNCSFHIESVDIIERINDSRPKYGTSTTIGVFNICGSYEGNNTFTLSSGRYEISSSPFINVAGNNVRGRINFNYSHFKKNAFANESEIIVVDTNNGWNGTGSLAEIFKYGTTLQGCKFLTDKKSIIYYD